MDERSCHESCFTIKFCEWLKQDYDIKIKLVEETGKIHNMVGSDMFFRMFLEMFDGYLKGEDVFDSGTFKSEYEKILNDRYLYN